MNPNQSAAYKNLEQAQQALKNGDRNTARQFAAQAAQLAPELEEVWLMMGALASTRGSVSYLEKAVQINPKSERAQKGLQWARARLEKETQSQIPTAPPAAEKAPLVVENAPVPTQTATEEKESLAPIPAIVEPLKTDPTRTQPRSVPAQPALPVETAQPAAKTQPVTVSKTIQSSNSTTRRRSSYLVVPLLILLCLIAIWAIWQGASPVAAFISSSAFTGAAHGPAWAPVNAAPANATQLSSDVTAVPGEPGNLGTSAPNLALPTTSSSTPVPGETTIPAASPTIPAPTDTSPAPSSTVPAPTDTSPAPANTALPTFTPLAAITATQELASVEQPSPTPLPTDTAAPVPTQYVLATPQPGMADAGGAGHWIDVDLTHQMVYAYDGNSLINSFVVSTGTWQHPTVTGQYHVYVKYRYTDMSGPGYYLPNVPFTMYFYQGYALHGTYWHSNFGTPMSHGCVNLSIPDSEWVYNWASVGTLVNVHY